jgi:hypothetical protein
MASNNTSMDVLRPEFWAGAFDELDVANYNLQNLVSRDQEGLIAKMGDTINIPVQTDLGEAADWTEGGSISGTAITQTVKQVILNKSKQSAIQLSAKELTMSAYDLIKTYGVPMAQSILQAVNAEIYKSALGSTLFNYVGAVSGLDEDDIIDAGASLSGNNVALDGRVIVASPTDMAKLKKCDAFQHADVTGDTGVMNDGRLTRKLGFDFYENPIIATYTPADVAGLINNKGAAYAAGETTVAVDTLNDDAAPIRVGDIITFAGEESAQKHTITATTTSSDDTVSITFSPALDGTSPADDDSAITITPTRSLLAMRRNAIAAAFRAYAPLPAGSGVSSSVINANGVPVRMSLYHDGKLGLMVVADVLFGVTLVNANRLCRIVTL